MNSLLVNRLSNLVGVFSVVLLIAALAITTFQVTQPQGPFQAAGPEDLLPCTGDGCNKDLSVQVFADVGGPHCDGNRTSRPQSSDPKLANITVEITQPKGPNASDGTLTYTRKTANNGFVKFQPVHFYNPDDTVTIRVIGLNNLCPNSPSELTLGVDDFGPLGSAYRNFRTVGVPTGTPTEPSNTPTPEPTAVETIAPTREVSPTPPGDAASQLSCENLAVQSPINLGSTVSVTAQGVAAHPNIGVDHVDFLYRHPATDACFGENSFQLIGTATSGSNGNYSINWNVPSDLSAGEYDIVANVFDRSGNWCDSNPGGNCVNADKACSCFKRVTVGSAGTTPTPTPPPATSTPGQGGPSGQSFQLDVWANNDPTNSSCYIAYDSTHSQYDNHNNNTYDGNRICNSRVLEADTDNDGQNDTRYAAKVEFTNLRNEAVSSINWQATKCDFGFNGTRRCDRADAARVLDGAEGELTPNQKITCTYEVIPGTVRCSKSGGAPNTPVPTPATTPGEGQGTISGAVTVEGEMPSDYKLYVVLRDLTTSPQATVGVLEVAPGAEYRFSVDREGGYGVFAYIEDAKGRRMVDVPDRGSDCVRGLETAEGRVCEVQAGDVQNFTLSVNSAIDATYNITNESDKTISAVTTVICEQGDTDPNCVGGVKGTTSNNKYTFYEDRSGDRIIIGQQYGVGCDIIFTDGTSQLCRPFQVAEGGKSITLNYTINADGTIESKGAPIGDGRGTQLPDVNFDGYIDGADVAAVVASYGTASGEADYNPRADFCGPNGDGSDGRINAYEVSCLIRDWNPRR